MTFATLAIRNLGRNKTRVFLTILGAAFAIIAFLLIRTVLWAWSYGAEAAAKDRIASRHKVSFVMQLPKNYIDKIRAVPGVTKATWANWFGGKDPKDENSFFANLAVDHESYLDVISEIQISPEARQRWMSDPQAALVGKLLANKMKLKEGDKVTLQGTIYPGDWEFHVAGIYTVSAKSYDESQFLFRWDRLNNAIPERSRNRDQIGWVMSRIDNAAQSGQISAAIDKVFDEQDVQTLTMSEKALNNSFIAMFEDVLKVLNYASFIILIILGLILGNTLAMGVRERTSEYGVLRAIGFMPKHIATFIVSEGLFVGFLGGLVGLLFGALLISGAAAAIAESPMAGMFPYFELQPAAVVMGMGFAIGLGGVASLIPAMRASKLQVTDALRRVG